MGIREKVEERRHAEDVKALAMALPLGSRRVKLILRCEDPGCGWVREQKVNIADPQAPTAFEDNLREARIHEGLYGHHAMRLSMERL